MIQMLSTGDVSAVTRVIPHHINEKYEFLEVEYLESNPNVVVISLNRVNKRNAINAKMWKEIGQVFEHLYGLGKIRCILLKGNGSSFCAGIDVNDPSFFPSTGEDVARTGLIFLPKLKEMQSAFTALERCLIPVVVAIHGSCIGAGIDLICAADIRICSTDALFSVREVALGLAADVGTLQRLPKITGNQSIVNELCFTASSFTASRALELGLVGQVSDHLIVDAVSLCLIIASHSPVAVRGTKQGLLYARDHTIPDGLDQIASFNALSLQSQDVPVAFAARMANISPKFSDFPPSSKL